MPLRAAFGSPAAAVPGQTARRELTVENIGDGAEDVRLRLEGEPAAWAWITPPALALGPGETASAVVTFKVPRAPRPPAGLLPVTVSITTATAPRDPVTATGTLDVAPFIDSHATLDPRVSRGRRAGRHVLRVENRGNTRLSAAVHAEGEELSLRVEPDRVDVAPGQSVEAVVTARPSRRRFRASTTTRSFEVLVQPDGPGTPGRVEGTVELAAAGWLGRVTLALLALAVAALGVAASFFGSSNRERSEVAGGAPPPAPVPASDCPARDHLSPDANGIVREGVRPSFDYTFLFVTGQGCQPVRFDPCQPVRYTLNRELASDDHVADLLEGLRKVSEATGLEFQRVADTNEDPRLVPRPRRQPDGSLGWPPIVIGWAHLGSGEQLRPPGNGRPSADVVVGGGGRPEIVNDVIVTGNLVLNLDAVTDTDTRRPVSHGFGPGVNWGRIILHELAHVIGLGHVQSRTSIMNEALTEQTISSSAWGIGDLIGLRQLGRDAGCVNVPPVPFQGAPR